jgi:hypothetical protein
VQASAVTPGRAVRRGTRMTSQAPGSFSLIQRPPGSRTHWAIGGAAEPKALPRPPPRCAASAGLTLMRQGATRGYESGVIRIDGGARRRQP